MTSPVTTPPPPLPPTGPAPSAAAASVPPPPPPANRAGAARPARAREIVAGAFSGTPGRMRLLGTIAIIASLVFGILAFLALSQFNSDLDAARANAEQLVRVQTIRTNLVKADANATNAFLVGGLEPPAVRSAYTDGIATTARSLAAAAAAESDDAAALERVNRVLTEYTGLIEAARANNRQGFPVGAAYLRQASRTLEEDALPPLADLVRVEQQRVEDSSSAGDRAQNVMIALLLLALAALVVPQLYLSTKTRRTFNPSLLAATAVVLIAGLVALGAVEWAQSQADDARAGPYRQTVGLASARIGGFDAKSAEALTLIARGSGAPFEARFQTASSAASAAIARDLADAAPGSVEAATATTFRDYLAEHKKLRALDDGGQHDQAVASATGTGAANHAFAKFDQASARALGTQAADLSDDLDRAASPLLPVAWLLLLAGIAAAVLAWRGMAQRLREYR
jgi:hypothetical protein